MYALQTPSPSAFRHSKLGRHAGASGCSSRRVPFVPPAVGAPYRPLSSSGRVKASAEDQEWGAKLPDVSVKDLQNIALRLKSVMEGAVAEETKPREEVPEEFSLPLAVGMARCAFESYLEPEEECSKLLQTAVNGTQVTFISKQMLTEKMDGILEVHMKNADGLPPSDLMRDENDPYAVLTLGNGSARTRTIDSVLVPEWEESLSLYVRDLESEVLRVRVMDADLLTADDLLGTAMLKLSSLAPNEAVDFELPLQGSGASGTVRFSAKFRPFTGDNTEALLEEVSAEVGSEVVEGTPQFIKDNLDFIQESLGASLPLNMWNELSDEETAALEDSAVAKSKEMQVAWKNLLHLADATAHGALQPVAYVESPETDTQAWVFWNPEAKTVCLAFRGTEQVKWKDLVTDLNMVPMPFNVERAESEGDSVFKRLFSKQDEPLVHAGFLSAWDSIRDSILSILDAIVDGDDEWCIYLTGHSLGGALATVCAAEMGGRPKSKGNPKLMYSFGAPRVGNTIFASMYEANAPVSWRVANRRDIVPTVPRLLGYQHIGQCAYLSKEGELEITTETSDIFGEGRVLEDMAGRAMDRAMDGEQGQEVLKSRLKEVYEHEMEILAGLQDGTAISEHMEDLYLTSLENLLLASSDAVNEA